MLSAAFFAISSMAAGPGESIAAGSTTTTGPLPDRTIGTCPAGYECFTIDAPVDHADPTGRTMPVSFAIQPASVATTTAFVTIVGGPGASGFETAAWATPYLQPLRSKYDLVFFELRGLEAWKSIDCPVALATNNDAYLALPTEPSQRWLELDDLQTDFGESCPGEVRRRDVLSGLTTKNVVEDLELFRSEHGYQTLVLYGESYGTQVAQAYAQTHPERVERMILDGVVDTSRDFLEATEDQIVALESSLGALFEACDNDRWCTYDMAAPAADVYDRLVTRLESGAAIVTFPVDANTSQKLPLTAEDIGYLAFSSMYEQSTRMSFLRALAAYGASDDLVPLLRLFGSGYDSGIEPIVNTAIVCNDSAYPADTESSLVELTNQARAAADPEDRWYYESVLGCVRWPDIRIGSTPSPPVAATGIPTLVLASDVDVATPYHRAVEVYAALETGYLLTVHNGAHVVFGRGDRCVDDITMAFAIDGTPPAAPACTVDLMTPYATLLPDDWSTYSPGEMVAWAEAEIYNFPEIAGWSGSGELTVGCSRGGEARFSDDGDTTSFVLDACALGDGLVVDGNGMFDWVGGSSTLDVVLGSTGCEYRYSYDWDTNETDTEETC